MFTGLAARQMLTSPPFYPTDIPQTQYFFEIKRDKYYVYILEIHCNTET